MNRLAHSASAYLQSAAHQPVLWYEWTPEAFTAAREQDKPILLDIGAVWCHWCHVIDRESYENPEIAALINSRFIPIKVDVDARPDIDRRYQEAVAAISGQGGWPLTVFLTPEGEVIYGGTYFPPEDRWGMPGMKSVLAKVSEAYQSNKAQVVAQAKRLHEEMSRLSERNIRSGALSAKILDKILADIESGFDEEFGGFGGAPKFPSTSALALLLRRYAATRDSKNLGIVTKSLDGMARGGMRDQLGGAFHRYSTDRFWRVPHFEVMLYVNGELLSLYAQAYQVTREPRYARVIEELLGYLARTLSDQKKGGFYGSQDADATSDDDGDYWTWTLEEAKGVLTPEEFETAGPFYGIEPQGEMRENPAKNVLYETAPAPSSASLLASARAKLLLARNKRKAPLIDRAIYINWNGLMVSGMLAAYQATGRKEALEFSLKALNRIWKEGYQQGRGLSHVIGEGARIPGFLEDYAYLLHAFLDAYEVTQDSSFLDRARQLAKDLEEHFWDKKNGGFFDARVDSAAPTVLQSRRKPIQDAPTPAGNSMAAWGMVRLYHVTGEGHFKELAEKTLTSFAATVESHGSFAASFGVALDALFSEPMKITIFGKRPDERTAQFLSAAFAGYDPNRYVTLADPATSPDKLQEAAAQICVGTRCLPRVTDPTKMKEAIDGARKSPL